MRNLSRLEKRTCLSSTCYRPSMVSNAFPDQSFSPCHHREIICSYIRTPTAPAVPRRYSFYAECPSLPSTVGFSRTPFSDCSDLVANGHRVYGRRARRNERGGEEKRGNGRPGCARTRNARNIRDIRRVWNSDVCAIAASESCPPNTRKLAVGFKYLSRELVPDRDLPLAEICTPSNLGEIFREVRECRRTVPNYKSLCSRTTEFFWKFNFFSFVFFPFLTNNN